MPSINLTGVFHDDPVGTTGGDLGTFAGTLFPDGGTAKSTLQVAETALEGINLTLEAGNMLRLTKADGTFADIDITPYLDDTNLARLTSGTLNGTTGIATFTRDDASTIDVDFSAFLSDLAFTGATNVAAGTQGDVPAPAAGDEGKFLRGDGTWEDTPLQTAAQTTSTATGNIAATNVDAAIAELEAEKVSTTLNDGDILIGNGANVATAVTPSGDAAISNAGVITIDDMVGATAGAAGTEGFVPAPAAGDQNKVLQGDGTWAEIQGETPFQTTVAGTNTAVAYDNWIINDGQTLTVSAMTDGEFIIVAPGNDPKDWNTWTGVIDTGAGGPTIAAGQLNTVLTHGGDIKLIKKDSDNTLIVSSA